MINILIYYDWLYACNMITLPTSVEGELIEKDGEVNFELLKSLAVELNVNYKSI